MRASILAVAIFLTIGMGSTANSTEHRYRAYNFYWNNSVERCFDLAQEIRNRLETQFGFSTLGAGCEYSDVTGTTNVVIRYEAPEAIPVVSTHRPRLDYQPSGFYENRDACERDLRRQETLFKTQTGLDVFLSYCTFSRHLSPAPWYVYVDGLGSASRFPWRNSFFTSKPHYPVEREVNEELVRSLKDHDTIVASIAWRPYIAHNRATLLAYGPKELDLNSNIVVEMPGLSQCAQTRDTLARDILASGSENYLTSFCASPYSGPRNFELRLVVVGPVPEIKYSGESFDNLSACTAALPALKKEMEQLHNVTTALCGRRPYTSKGFRVAFIL